MFHEKRLPGSIKFGQQGDQQSSMQEFLSCRSCQSLKYPKVHLTFPGRCRGFSVSQIDWHKGPFSPRAICRAGVSGIVVWESLGHNLLLKFTFLQVRVQPDHFDWTYMCQSKHWINVYQWLTMLVLGMQPGKDIVSALKKNIVPSGEHE